MTLVCCASCAAGPTTPTTPTSSARIIATAEPSVQWAAHVIKDGLLGADGASLADVNADGLLDVATPWEESGVVTVSLHPTPATLPWQTVTIATGFAGVEDAVFADVDDDGNMDVISASENTPRRVTVHFAPAIGHYLDASRWVTVPLTASTNLQNWLKVAFADIDGDGRADIIAGGKAGYGGVSTVGWFKAPTNPRTGSAWVYTPLSQVGWTMSLIARDLDADGDQDILLSDRQYITNPDNSRNYTLMGSRWLENGASWANHSIGDVLGGHKFLSVADYDGDGSLDVLDGRSSSNYNQTFFKRNLGGWLSWATAPIQQPANVGQYQDVKAGDIDGDGSIDLVFSYSAATSSLSGVVWQKSDGTRGEISGSAGTKYDNVELYDVDGDGDLDVVTTEQIDQLGVIWFENPTTAPKLCACDGGAA